MTTRLCLVIPLVVVTAHLGLEPAAAQLAPTPTCGQPDAGSTPAKVSKGTLTLDDTSKTTINYGRDTKKETLNLLMGVSGCELANDAPDPSVFVRPKPGSEELPDDLITLRDAIPEGSTLEVSLNVNAEAFDPGSYEAFIVLRAPHLVTSRTPVAVSRSEDNWLVPALIGAVSGLVGFLWFTLGKLVTKEELTMSWFWLIPVGIAAAVFGVLAVGAAWWDQDVWSVDENLPGAIAAGIAGATTGAMLTLLPALWRGKTPKTPPSRTPPSRTPSPPGG
jgi:hypothetical protein